MAIDVRGVRTLALLIAVFGCGDLAWAQAPAVNAPPAGHLRVVSARRTVTPPVIDGVINEAAWQAAGVAENFWISDQQEPPTDATRVVILYDDRAIYFAFTCFDAEPDQIRATQIVRDAAPGFDDRVTVELDPFHNHRTVSRFTVTARGTQSDALAGGRAARRDWKGEWDAATRRTSAGWTAEIAIPLELLAFDVGSDTFGLNLSRYQNRTREWSEWANLTPQRLAEEAGHLTGLRLPEPASAPRVSVMQYVTGAVSPAAHHGAASPINSGVDVRYQWRRTLTSVVSVRPDFSGVDTEVSDIGFSYTEKFVRDYRPFFQEGSEFFGDREVFYSGRIDEFDVAAKTFGRVDDYQIGVLATADTDTGRADYVGRVVREVGETFNVSATLAGTNAEAVDNAIVQLRAEGRLGRNVQVKGTLAHASTDGSRHGVRGRGEFGYSTAHWYSAGWVDHTDADYRAPNGFLAGDLIGTTGQGVYGGYTRAFGHAWMRRANVSVSYDVRETATGLPQREMTAIYAGADTAANIQLNAGMSTGAYRPRSTMAGEWADSLNADRFYLASAFYQAPTGQFGYGAQYSWGVAGLQDYAMVSPSVWLAPNPHLSLAYSFERATYGSVEHQHVVSGGIAISGDQSVAARWVQSDGDYYRLSYRQTLRDGIDAIGVYTSDPYDAGGLSMKIVWSWLR